MLHSKSLSTCLFIALYATLKVIKYVSPYCAVCYTQGHYVRVSLLRCMLHSRSQSTCLLIALYATLKVTKYVSHFCAVYYTQGHQVRGSLLPRMLHSRSLSTVSFLPCMLHSRSLNTCILIALYATLKVTKYVSPYCAVCYTQSH